MSERQSFSRVTVADPKGAAMYSAFVNDFLPNYFEVTAQVTAGKPTGGYQSNAFIIFDYQSATDFKFAGIDGSTSTPTSRRKTPAPLPGQASKKHR